MAAPTEPRFLVVAHDPIPMTDQSISQLVSVDLQTAEELVEG